jgi:hypothetical protein
LYISATHPVVSRALVIKKEATHKGTTTKQQYPVYFASEVLAESKKYYSEVKICYTIVMSPRKLRHYFEAHTIRVLTDQPFYNIFRNRDSSRRIGKWATKLLEYIVDFEKRNGIKSHILADLKQMTLHKNPLGYYIVMEPRAAPELRLQQS